MSEFVNSFLQVLEITPEPLPPPPPKMVDERTTTLPRDKESVLKILNSPKPLPPKAEFERTLPQWLLQDRDIVLAFLSRSDFSKLYRERGILINGLLPNALKSDKEVVLAYCRRVPCAGLQDCSEDLCDDVDVVQAAITVDGAALQYASRRWHGDKDMLVLACQTNGGALDLCPPGNVRNELVNDTHFMLEALRNGLLLRQCPPLYRTDIPFLLEAIQRRASLYLQVDRSVRLSDRNLALMAVGSSSANSDVLICALRDFPQSKDIVSAVVQAICDSTTSFAIIRTVSAKILNAHPEIICKCIECAERRRLDEFRRCLDDRTAAATAAFSDIWTIRNVAIAWIRRGATVQEAFGDLLGDREVCLEIAAHSTPSGFSHVSEVLRADVDFMIQAVTANGRVLRHAIPGPQLLENHMDVILAAITELSAVDIMDTLPPETLQAHPELVCKAIECADGYRMDDLSEAIRPAAVWNRRDVAIAWIRRGKDIRRGGMTRHRRDLPDEEFREMMNGDDADDWIAWVQRRRDIRRGGTGGMVIRPEFRHCLEDREVCLEIAEHAPDEFHRIRETLRGDLEFMTQSVSRNGRVLRFASHPLLENKSLAVAAVANTAMALEGTRWSRDDLITEFETKTEQQRVYMEFLRGIDIDRRLITPPAFRCRLPVLDLGNETTRALKMRIASFLDFPVGRDLTLMRQALENLRMDRMEENKRRAEFPLVHMRRLRRI